MLNIVRTVYKAYPYLNTALIIVYIALLQNLRVLCCSNAHILNPSLGHKNNTER